MILAGGVFPCDPGGARARIILATCIIYVVQKKVGQEHDKWRENIVKETRLFYELKSGEWVPGRVILVKKAGLGAESGGDRLFILLDGNSHAVTVSAFSDSVRRNDPLAPGAPGAVRDGKETKER